jgi:hypothetical protein|tara:strand:+ start:2232 stop:2834 length:603 start_codon:yes stop_codon:yes gene_type:complete
MGNMLFEQEEFAKRGLAKRKQLSPKQEKFAQLFVNGDLTKKECAIRAGYKNPSVSSSNLLHHVNYKHVQERIAELTEATQLRYGITFEKTARDLKMIRDAALEDGAYGPAITAEVARAKLAGLMVDKKEIKTGKIDQMDRGEVESRLRSLIEKHGLNVNTTREDVEDAEFEEVIEDEEIEDEVQGSEEDIHDDEEENEDG